MSRIRVAAGILTDADGRVLISERRGDPLFDGFWEFPGGKIHDGESGAEALARELDEELGIAVLATEPLVSLAHDYEDRSVAIDFFLVRRWQANPVAREGQQLKWVRVDALDAERLLPADQPVVEFLQKMQS